LPTARPEPTTSPTVLRGGQAARLAWPPVGDSKTTPFQSPLVTGEAP